jgi:hypothetical protein
MTSLRLELSTLVTSHTSLQNTVSLLQVQLADLKRVNHGLQEENESYNILLRERTLNGQFDVMRQMAPGPGSTSSDEDGDSSDDGSGSINGSGSYLGTVEEHPDETLDPEFDNNLGPDVEGERLGVEGAPGQTPRSRHGRKHGGLLPHSPKNRGESLADLPITGPGLDLAAELGRAENKDILEGDVDAPAVKLSKRGKKGSSESRHGIEPSGSTNDVDAMKSKIKSLEDANKALSLYASKIIDRIIAQEGFEHVLAVDYDAKSPEATPSASDKHKRRASMFARSSNAVTSPQPERLTTFSSPPPPNQNPPTSTANSKRRSLSFDWRALSLFSGEKKTDPHLRPLTLQAGQTTVTSAHQSPASARKLDNEEDEEDRRERERLNATMKLMGIEKPAAMQKSLTEPAPARGPMSPVSPDGGSGASTPATRFTFFRRGSATPDTSLETPSVLTTEALAQAEAANALAALDAREKQLGLELERGSSGGFTEITRKPRRGRASGGGSNASGSTVWSAGMSHDHVSD